MINIRISKYVLINTTSKSNSRYPCDVLTPFQPPRRRAEVTPSGRGRLCRTCRRGGALRVRWKARSYWKRPPSPRGTENLAKNIQARFSSQGECTAVTGADQAGPPSSSVTVGPFAPRVPAAAEPAGQRAPGRLGWGWIKLMIRVLTRVPGT